MKKVLIVDDDALVRMFLRQIIPWEDEGCTVVGDARDGEEALELAGQTRPDLILSDVSMPTMDGVELVRRLRAEGFGGGIIMLSCHDDFEYVKNAMQLGADEYLLKNHLSPDSLRAALAAVGGKRAAAEAPSPAMEKLAQKGRRALQREALERLLAERPEEPPLLREAGFAARYRVCAACLLRMPPDAGKLFELCCQIASAGGFPDVEAAGVGPRGCAFLLDLTGQPSELAQQERARALAARVETGLRSYLRLEATMGVSRPCSGAHAVSDALRQANEALVAAFYGEGTYWYGTEAAALSEAVPEAAVRFREELPALLTGDRVTFETAYAMALAAFARERTLPGVVLRWLQSCDAKAGITRTPKTYAALDRLTGYQGCAAEYLLRMETLANQCLPENLSPQIAAAVRYLQAHFPEPVTLGDAAAEAGFNPSYFSSVFKRELGVGFSEYLTDLRLARVRQQLLEGGGTIKEIAQRAGFFDYRHFCKTFKKKTGLSPAEYRREGKK